MTPALRLMTPVDFALWVALPYLSIAVFLAGHVWRYRRDRFGWTDEWMQLFKPRALRWGIVTFHLGAFAVIGGHFLGIVVPNRLTAELGVGDAQYRVLAVAAGGLAGLLAVVGAGAFLWRRTRVGPVARNTRPMDLVTLSVLALVIVLGMVDVIGVNLLGGGYDYRSSVSVWFRSVLALSPDYRLMASAPLPYQLHAVAAWLVFVIWPFSRLVHVWYLPFWAHRRLLAAISPASASLGEVSE